MSQGILVLCTQSDWYKAFAMICSLRIHNKTIPIATVATPEVLKLLAPVSDYLIEENPKLRGFAHKLEIDRYSPFEKTLFVDADMLWFEDPLNVIKKFEGSPYGVRGRYVVGGFSSFGLDRTKIAKDLNVDKVVNIDGAGHAYYEKPACTEIFNKARYILENYSTIAPGIKVADEDIIAIAMTELGYAPTNDKNIVGFHGAAILKTLKLDVLKGVCDYTDLEGDPLTPALIHFPRDMSPWTYHVLMEKVIKNTEYKLDVPWKKLALKDWFRVEVFYRVGNLVKKFK